jgi:hypothetical protein
MNLRRLDFLFAAAMAAAIATPVLGQTGGGPGSPAQRAASVPDFSGIWAHPTLPGFEPPLSGPGPVRNRSRTPNGVGNFNQLVGDYTNPVLKPEAAQIVKQHGDLSIAGVTYPTPSNQCWPGGVPYMFWNIEMQMFQRAREVTLLYLVDHQVRHVHMNQSHPAKVTPSLLGDSVGHYEGDTLVVDTVGIKAGPFAMVDMYGTPHSQALHVVERYRSIDYEATKAAAERDEKDNLRLPDERNDVAVAVDHNYTGKGLQLQFTVEDDGVFTMPWSATITYRRAANEWRENVCAENMHEYYYNKEADVPTADRPDF